MRNSGQSALCSGSSRLADDTPGDVFSQSERSYREAQSLKLGGVFTFTSLCLVEDQLAGSCETLRSWKMKSDCFGEG